GMYSFKTSSPIRLARFWGALMDLPLAEGASSDLAMLDFEHEKGPVTWLFERAEPGDTPPSGRLGLDISNDDDATWATAANRAVSLGATRIAEHEQGGARGSRCAIPTGTRSAYSLRAARSSGNPYTDLGQFSPRPVLAPVGSWMPRAPRDQRGWMPSAR